MDLPLIWNLDKSLSMVLQHVREKPKFRNDTHENKYKKNIITVRGIFSGGIIGVPPVI